MEIKRDLAPGPDRAVFDEKSRAIERPVAMDRREAKGIRLDHHMPGLVGEQLVRDARDDTQAGAEFEPLKLATTFGNGGLAIDVRVVNGGLRLPEKK